MDGGQFSSAISEMMLPIFRYEDVGFPLSPKCTCNEYIVTLPILGSLKKTQYRILMSSSINTLKELLLEEIKDLYDAEKQLVKALPKMARAATSADLKEGFTTHLEETKTHVSRLEQILEKLDAPIRGKTCKAMQGLVAEGDEAIDLEGPDAIRDACLIGAAQRVEHYEIAAYGTARGFAEVVEENEVVDLLQETLDEEKNTDKTLTTLAETINEEANTLVPEKEQVD